MGLEVYYKRDVINTLLAAEQATGEAMKVAGAADDPFVAGYLAGHRATLATIALAFGLADDDDCAGLPSLTRGNGRMLALLRGR